MLRRHRWPQSRISCLAIFASVFVAVLALQLAQARAALILDGNYEVYFYDDTVSPDDDTTIDWMGTFTTDSSGLVTSFMASIGTCDMSSKCLFDKKPDLTFDGYELIGSIDTAAGPGSLSLYLGTDGDWETSNKFDSIDPRMGSYYVGSVVEPEKIPEPGSLSLFFVGLGFLVWFASHSRRRSQALPHA